jgi:hypothetical protein
MVAGCVCRAPGAEERESPPFGVPTRAVRTACK